MDNLNVIRQVQVEKKMLKYLVEGLLSTLNWQIQGDDFSRKLSTLKFITRSFQNHQERLMALEEKDGYMDLVVDRHPHLSSSVESLRNEHDSIRQSLEKLTASLSAVTPTDNARLAESCDELRNLLKIVELHHRKESDLFQEAFEREEGGEG
jgi:hemerythrin-like domain-containing protein